MLELVPRGGESRFWRWGSPVLAVVLTGLLSGVLFAAMGRPAGRTVYTFLVVPLLQPGGLEALVVKAAPLVMMGAGLSLAYRANIWNIGAEGQFVVGAVFGGGVALAWPDGPGWLVFLGMVVCGGGWGDGLGRGGGVAAGSVQCE